MLHANRPAEAFESFCCQDYVLGSDLRRVVDAIRGALRDGLGGDDLTKGDTTGVVKKVMKGRKNSRKHLACRQI
jgi:hypothetical protein